MALPAMVLGAAAAAAGWALLKRQRVAPASLAEPLGDPDDPETWEAHLLVAVQREDWSGAVRFHLRLAAFSRGEAQVDHLLAAARVFEDRLADAEGAIACYEDVLRINPQDTEALSGLDFLGGSKAP